MSMVTVEHVFLRRFMIFSRTLPLVVTGLRGCMDTLVGEIDDPWIYFMTFNVSCNLETSNHIRYPISSSHQLLAPLVIVPETRPMGCLWPKCDYWRHRSQRLVCQHVNEGYDFSSGLWYKRTSHMSTVATVCTTSCIEIVRAFLLPFYDVPAYLGNKFAHPQRSMQSSCHFCTCTPSRWRRLKSFQLHAEGMTNRMDRMSTWRSRSV